MKILKIILFFFVTILTLFGLWFSWLYDFKGEKIYIENGYLGDVKIYYNRKNGSKLYRDRNGSIIYKIPSNGIFAVNFEDYINRGTPIANRDYFLVHCDSVEKFVEFDIGRYSTKYYELVYFRYGSDSTGVDGANYYSESFQVIKK